MREQEQEQEQEIDLLELVVQLADNHDVYMVNALMEWQHYKQEIIKYNWNGLTDYQAGLQAYKNLVKTYESEKNVGGQQR